MTSFIKSNHFQTHRSDLRNPTKLYNNLNENKTIYNPCKNKENFKQSRQWLNFFWKLLPEMKKRNNCWCEIYEVAIK